MYHDPEEFISEQGKPYRDSVRKGWTSIEVLPFLKGKPWDAVALSYVHALRPSYIRVVDGAETTDSICWRVTVNVSGGVIENITQEVEVTLPPGVCHGQALEHALHYGLESEQVAWHRNAIGYFVDPTGYYKDTKTGIVRFPDSDT